VILAPLGLLAIRVLLVTQGLLVRQETQAPLALRETLELLGLKGTQVLLETRV